MFDQWNIDEPGVVQLPSGRRIRGRGLRKEQLPYAHEPTFGLYLYGREIHMSWESRWLKWRDFWLPSNRELAHAYFVEALERAGKERVEVACGGGKGRTGTALACIAILDGVSPKDAVAYVRDNYNRHAIETPWQKHYVAGFRQSLPHS